MRRCVGRTLQLLRLTKIELLNVLLIRVISRVMRVINLSLIDLGIGLQHLKVSLKILLRSVDNILNSTCALFNKNYTVEAQRNKT